MHQFYVRFHISKNVSMFIGWAKWLQSFPDNKKASSESWNAPYVILRQQELISLFGSNNSQHIQILMRSKFFGKDIFICK